jgi:hypothetical protein
MQLAPEGKYDKGYKLRVDELRGCQRQGPTSRARRGGLMAGAHEFAHDVGTLDAHVYATHRGIHATPDDRRQAQEPL